MTEIRSVRDLDEFRRRAISYLEDVKRSMSIALEDRLDPDEWTDPVSPIRHAIRSNMAVRVLIDYLLANNTDHMVEYSKLIQGYTKSRLSEIAALGFEHLSEHDLWNLSNYGDSIAAIDILVDGELLDPTPVQFSSDAYCRRQELASDSEQEFELEEQIAYEAVRNLLLGGAGRVTFDLEEDHLQRLDPRQSIFNAVSRLISLCAQTMSGCVQHNTKLGVNAYFSLVRMKWYDSRIEGSFDLTSDRFLLVAFARELAFGNRGFDPASLIHGLRPEQIHHDVEGLLDIGATH